MFSQAQFDKDLHVGSDLPCKIFVRCNDGTLITRADYVRPTVWDNNWKHITKRNLRFKNMCSPGFFHYYRNPLQLILNMAEHTHYYEQQYEIYSVETNDDLHQSDKSGCRSMRILKPLFIPRLFFYRAAIWMAYREPTGDWLPSCLQSDVRNRTVVRLSSLHLPKSILSASSLPNMENDLRNFFKVHNLESAFGKPKSYFID